MKKKLFLCLAVVLACMYSQGVLQAAVVDVSMVNFNSSPKPLLLMWVIRSGGQIMLIYSIPPPAEPDARVMEHGIQDYCLPGKHFLLFSTLPAAFHISVYRIAP